MNYIYVILGVMSILLAVASARAELSVSPQLQETCCDVLQYDVVLSNTDNALKRVYSIDVTSYKDVWASLEPELIVLQPREELPLTMFVRPSCEASPGSYDITITVECTNCVDLTETAEVTAVKQDCAPKEEIVIDEPVVEPETQIPEESPTGAIVSTEDSTLAIILIVLVLAVVMLMLGVTLTRSAWN